MPGVNDSYFFLAFDTDKSGQAVPAFEPRQTNNRPEAIEAAKALAAQHAGAIAWRRHVEPAIGELGPPEIIFSAGHVGDFS